MDAFIHDLFTLLCDLALNRPPQAWRWQKPEPARRRFLAVQAQAAGLIEAETGRPSALAEAWLRQTPAEQVATLAQAWAATRDTAARQRCLARVAAMTVDQRLTPAALTGRRSLRHQRDLWQPLAWLGYLRPEPSWAEPQRLVRLALPQPPAAYPAWQVEERPATAGRRPPPAEREIQEEVSQMAVVVEPPYAWADLWLLEQIVLLETIGPPRRYRLDPAHWRRALGRGFSPAVALALLERASGEPLPVAPARFLGAALPDVFLRPGVLLTFTDAAQLDALRRRPAWRTRLAFPLSPRHVWLPAADAAPVAAALERLGLAARLEPSPADALAARPSRRSGDHLRLLVAARVLGALAEELDLPAPLDDAALAAVAAQLPAAQQRRLEQWVAAQVAHLRRRLPEPAAAPPPASPAEDILATLTAALQSGHPLRLIYQPPPPRPAITRPVLPLRLEAWGVHTYLIAHCLHRRAPRTFRLDRILAAEPL